MFLFIFLVLVVYLTVRAFTNHFLFIEYLILIAAIVVMLYHGTKKFI